MQIVNLETAKLAKEAGFDWPCNDVYYLKDKKEIRLHTLFYYDELHRNGEDNLILSLSKDNQEVICSVPQQAYLQKWLRDVHRIHVTVQRFIKSFLQGKNKDTPYFVMSCQLTEDEMAWIDNKYHASNHSSYEEALEKGLQKGLEILKNAINKDND